MASFHKRGNSIKTVIRKKNVQIIKSFNDMETAKLWAKYKEDLIDEMDAFEVPKNELIILKDALNMFYHKMESKNYDKKMQQDLRNLTKHYNNFLDFPLKKISYDILLEHSLEMLNSKVKRGTQLQGKGIEKDISFRTVRNRISNLGIVYSFLIDNGIDVENVTIRVKAYLLNKFKE